MRHSLAVFLLLTLVACGTDPVKDENASADELYSRAKESLQDQNYEKAIKQLESLQSRYPYGRYAQQSQMEVAYAYFKHDEAAAAISTIDRFVKQYPNSPNLDYMLYLKGLANFNENINSLLGTFFKQDPSERDPSALRESFDAFKEMVTRFPASKYTPDAKLRMQYLLITLAKSDLHVASYYLRRGAFVAAANRAKSILLNYPQTPQSRDALQVMIQAYGAMGLNDLRDDTQRILDNNIAKNGGERPIVREMPRTEPWWKFWA